MRIVGIVKLSLIGIYFYNVGLELVIPRAESWRIFFFLHQWFSTFCDHGMTKQRYFRGSEASLSHTLLRKSEC
jgi:hypothetical protein